MRIDSTRDFWEIRWYDPPSWLAHGLIHWGGWWLCAWAGFSPEQCAVVLLLGCLGWYAREECQGWSLDGILDMVGPIAVTAWAWWPIL